MRRVVKFYEIYLGWFFVNGQKQEKYQEYLKSKYSL